MSLLSIVLLFSTWIVPISQTNNEQVKRLSCEVDLVVLGEVTDLGTPPDFWSGQFSATQAVSYKVVEVLKGHLDVNRLNIRVFVVQGSPLSDAEKPRLSPRIFSNGKVHLLFLKLTPNDEKKNASSPGTYSASEVNSVILATEELITSIRQTSCERQD